MLKAVVELAAYGVAATLAAVCFLVWAWKWGGWSWAVRCWLYGVGGKCYNDGRENHLVRSACEVHARASGRPGVEF